MIKEIQDKAFSPTDLCDEVTTDSGEEVCVLTADNERIDTETIDQQNTKSKRHCDQK